MLKMKNYLICTSFLILIILVDLIVQSIPQENSLAQSVSRYYCQCQDKSIVAKFLFLFFLSVSVVFTLHNSQQHTELNQEKPLIIYIPNKLLVFFIRCIIIVLAEVSIVVAANDNAKFLDKLQFRSLIDQVFKLRKFTLVEVNVSNRLGHL